MALIPEKRMTAVVLEKELSGVAVEFGMRLKLRIGVL